MISFKVDDDFYFTLKKIMQTKNLSFRALFEPYAVKLCENSNMEMKYTVGIPANTSSLYKDIQLVLKKYEKRLKND